MVPSEISIMKWTEATMKLNRFIGIWYCETEVVPVFDTDQGDLPFDQFGSGYLIE